MNLLSMMSLVLALSSAVAVAAPQQNACDRVALAAARVWAKKAGLSMHNFSIAGYENDRDGNTVVHIQLPLYGSDGDCWTNMTLRSPNMPTTRATPSRPRRTPRPKAAAEEAAHLRYPP